MVTHIAQADAVEVRFFVHEHREIRQGLSAIAEVADQAERLSSSDLAHSVNALLRWLDQTLQTHAMWEEEWLYPHLETIVAGPWLTRLLAFDHHQIRERIEGLKADRDVLIARVPARRSHTLLGHLFGLEALILAHLDREDRFVIAALDEAGDGRIEASRA